MPLKPHIEWSNSQGVAVPTTTILPTVAGTYHNLNCFTYMIYEPQTSMYQNSAKLMTYHCCCCSSGIFFKRLIQFIQFNFHILWADILQGKEINFSGNLQIPVCLLPPFFRDRSTGGIIVCGVKNGIGELCSNSSWDSWHSIYTNGLVKEA